jgi:dCMP deaminase
MMPEYEVVFTPRVEDDFFYFAEEAKLLEKRALEELVFLKMAKEFSGLSKCVSRQVAALVVKDGRIITTGINGTLPGKVNCCERFGPDFDREVHHEWSLKNELHAEINAICRSTESIQGSTVYMTLEPCQSCSLLLVASGVKRVVFSRLYDKTPSESRKILLDSGVEVSFIDLGGTE